MTTPTDRNRDLLTIIASLHAAPGKSDELRKELEEVVRNTVSQPGCVNYDLHEALEEPGTFFIYENWESLEQNQAHVAQPYLARFLGIMGELLDERGITITHLRRIA